MDHRIFIVIYYTFYFVLSSNGDNNIIETISISKLLSKFTYIHDAPVIYPSLTNVDSYAFATAPQDTVYIAQSSLPNAGLGVFAARPIAHPSYFGPYGGYKHNDPILQKNSDYAWKIPDKSGNTMYCVDASEPNKSNWLRFVNSPNTSNQRNLLAFVHDGDIFYITARNISAGEELLVYYGNNYAKKLGIDTTKFS